LTNSVATNIARQSSSTVAARITGSAFITVLGSHVRAAGSSRCATTLALRESFSLCLPAASASSGGTATNTSEVLLPHRKVERQAAIQSGLARMLASPQLAPHTTVAVNVSSRPAKQITRRAASIASMSASVGTDGQSTAAGSSHGVPSRAAAETQPSWVTRLATGRTRYQPV
jgi:hypothetical protein